MPRSVTVYTDDELGLAEGWDKNPTDGSQLDPNIRAEIRQNRILNRELGEAREQAQAAERQLVLYKAGIPNDKRGDLFVKSYEGELTPEAVKGAFEELFGTVQTGTGDEGLGGEHAIQTAQTGAQTNGENRIPFEEALRAAKGNPAKVRELLLNAPESAGIRLTENIQ